MKKTVCICGTNPITRELTDWTLDADYWYFNESVSGSEVQKPDGTYGWVHDRPVNGVFQMHVPPIWRNTKNPTHPGHYEWLTQPHDYPIFMQAEYPDVPASVRYPKDEIMRALLPGFVNETGDSQEYFTSTAAYAIALAIYQGRKVIRLFGIEAANNTDYLRQRAGITFWCGLAIGRGVKVVRLSKSLLMNEPIYGYKGEVMIQKQEIEISANRWTQEAAKAQATMFEFQGKMRGILESLKQTRSQKDANRLFSEFLRSTDDYSEWTYKYGFACGAAAENQRYLKEINDLIDAAGGEKALEAIVNGEQALVMG